MKHGSYVAAQGATEQTRLRGTRETGGSAGSVEIGASSRRGAKGTLLARGMIHNSLTPRLVHAERALSALATERNWNGKLATSWLEALQTWIRTARLELASS